MVLEWHETWKYAKKGRGIFNVKGPNRKAKSQQQIETKLFLEGVIWAQSNCLAIFQRYEIRGFAIKGQS